MMDYCLVPITELDKNIQLKILSIRNEENVRKWMYTDHIIPKEEHLAWISRLESNDKQKVFAIMENETTPIGVISLNDIDPKHKKAEWAFYIDQNYQGGGLGAALELKFIDYCFNTFKLEKINCEVIEGNVTVIKLHKRFLFCEEGYLRENIVKNNNRIGVYLLGLTKSDWLTKGKPMREKYGEILHQYNILIKEGEE